MEVTTMVTRRTKQTMNIQQIAPFIPPSLYNQFCNEVEIDLGT